MLCAVIGHPVQHSVSPQMYREFNRDFNFDLSYERLDSEPSQFLNAVKHFRARGGRYLNVTAPFKTEAYALAVQHGQSCQYSKSASLLDLQAEGGIYANNFDGLGLVRDIAGNWRYSLEGKKILFLGAGGAARDALPALKNAGAIITLCNRSLNKASDLAKSLALQCVPYDALQGLEFDLLINGTSSSLHHVDLPLPKCLFSDALACYDLSYHPSGETHFLKQCAAAGASNLRDGLGMLVEQGAEVFKYWYNVEPKTKKLIEQRAWLNA